jgi:hypothetical protein
MSDVEAGSEEAEPREIMIFCTPVDRSCAVRAHLDSGLQARTTRERKHGRALTVKTNWSGSRSMRVLS